MLTLITVRGLYETIEHTEKYSALLCALGD